MSESKRKVFTGAQKAKVALAAVKGLKTINEIAIDSQSIKTTDLSGTKGFDAGKQIQGRKRHILLDTLGLIMVVVVTATSVQEQDGAKLIFKALTGSYKKIRRIWVDGGYRGPKIMDWIGLHDAATLF
jgi:hypothetical protein